jgi:hypothetical protein
MTESSKSKLWWFAGLFVRLGSVSLLSLMLWFALVTAFGKLKILTNAPAWLIILVLWLGYTWAVYFDLPIFLKRSRWQRILISSVPALVLMLLTGWMALRAVNAIFFGKSVSDQRMESVTLPSGEVLENHTYCDDGGWPSGSRINQLFLKNPATGTSERIDAHGDLDYSYGPSLLELYPHPQEIVRGDEKVLIIGSFVCKRCVWKTGPEWDIASFGGAWKREGISSVIRQNEFHIFTVFRLRGVSALSD